MATTLVSATARPASRLAHVKTIAVVVLAAAIALTIGVFHRTHSVDLFQDCTQVASGPTSTGSLNLEPLVGDPSNAQVTSRVWSQNPFTCEWTEQTPLANGN